MSSPKTLDRAASVRNVRQHDAQSRGLPAHGLVQQVQSGRAGQVYVRHDRREIAFSQRGERLGARARELGRPFALGVLAKRGEIAPEGLIFTGEQDPFHQSRQTTELFALPQPRRLHVECQFQPVNKFLPVSKGLDRFCPATGHTLEERN